MSMDRWGARTVLQDIVATALLLLLLTVVGGALLLVVVLAHPPTDRPVPRPPTGRVVEIHPRHVTPVPADQPVEAVIPAR